jgi:hypothetical protein
MIAYVARGIAAVGAILGAVAIWTELEPGGGSYWDSPHHAVGITMLVLVILGGFAIFLPITIISDGNGSALRAGAWLGVASACLFVIAAVVNAIPVAAWSSQPAQSAPSAAAPQQESAPEPEPAAPPPPDQPVD